MKAVNFQDFIPSFPVDNFRDKYVIVIHLTPLQDGKENYHYPENVGEPLRLELNFTFPPEHNTGFLVLGGRFHLVAVGKFCVAGNNNLKA